MTKDGQPTENYLDWYEATVQLSPKQWKCGFDRVERKVRADLANDRDPWPPTTPKMFVVMCEPPQSEVSGTAGMSAQSQKRHPNLVERDKREKLQIEQPGRKERVKAKGNDALKLMMQGDFSPRPGKRNQEYEED